MTAPGAPSLAIYTKLQSVARSRISLCQLQCGRSLSDDNTHLLPRPHGWLRFLHHDHNHAHVLPSPDYECSAPQGPPVRAAAGSSYSEISMAFYLQRLDVLRRSLTYRRPRGRTRRGRVGLSSRLEIRSQSPFRLSWDLDILCQVDGPTRSEWAAVLLACFCN